MTKIVNRKELGEILGVSGQTLSNWLKEGLPIVQDNGTNAGKLYDTAQVIAWMVDRKTGGNGAGAIVAKDEDVLLTRERRRNLEMKNAILSREYAPIEVISTTVAKVAGQIAAVLDTLPLTMKRKLPDLSITDLEIVKREVVKCQNIASKAGEHLAQEIDQACKSAAMAPNDA